MEVRILGTGAGHRSRERAASSQLIRDGRTAALVDCGPGTLDAILQHRAPTHLDAILLTHGHPDHVGDLFNVLAYWSATGRTSAVSICAPAETLEDVYADVARLTRMGSLEYPVSLVDMRPRSQLDLGDLAVQAFPTDHRMDSRGYRLARRSAAPRIDLARVQALGLAPGPWMAEIKAGRTVVYDGREIAPAMVCHPALAPLAVAVTGDTAASDIVVDAVRGVDVLVHDATFANDKQAHAARWGHATAQQAAEVARAAEARAVVLTHFSHRYAPSAMPHLAEAAEVFAGVVLVAQDGDRINARTLAVTSGHPERRPLVAGARTAARWHGVVEAFVREDAAAGPRAGGAEAAPLAPQRRELRP